MDKKDNIAVEEQEAVHMDEEVSKELVAVEPEIDVDQEAEKICRWAAARAGAIVITPFLGSVTLMANEVYMISRLATLYGVDLENGAIAGLMGSLGASFIGQTFFTFIPFPPLQVPMAVSITYGVGKAANAWLKAGGTSDFSKFKEVYEQARKEGLSKVKEFVKNPGKDLPLGDESKKFDFNEKVGPLFEKIKVEADGALGKVESALNEAAEAIAPYKEMGQRWLTAQNVEALKKGGIIIPYEDLEKKMQDSAAEGEFKLVACRYHAPEEIEVDVEHTKHGILRLILAVENFTINNTEGSVKFRVQDFSVLENSLAQLVIKALGTKLIRSLVNLVFSNTTIAKEDIVCSYGDSVMSIDFTKVLEHNEYLQKDLKGKKILDLVQFVGLVPQATGMLVQSKFTLKKLKE